MRLLTIGLVIWFLGAGCKKRKKHIKDNAQTTSPSQSKSIQKTNHHKKPIADSTLKDTLTLRREQIYSSTNKVVVGYMETFAVDKRGRVFIADRDKTTIEVFAPDGHYLKSLGREGKGPGEFSAITGRTNMIIKKGRLYVTDYAKGFNFFPIRLQVFSLDKLSFSKTIKILANNKENYPKLEGYFPTQAFPRKNGKFLVAYRRSPNEYKDSKSYIRYVVQDSTGKIVHGIILQQRDRINLSFLNKESGMSILVVYAFPFYRKSLFKTSENKHMYAVNNTQIFKISVYNANGDHIRSFSKSFHKVPVSRRSLIDHYQNKLSKLGKGVAAKMIRHADHLPSTWPALHAMLLDDQHRLWLSTIMKNQRIYRWWILDNTGEVQAKFDWPRSKPIRQIRDGKLYTRETDSSGVARIVRYGIQMN